MIPLSEFKIQLGLDLSDETEDAKLAILLQQASAIAESYTKRRLFASDVTEYYGGNGTNQIILKSSPVNSVTTVHEDRDRTAGVPPGSSQFGAASLLVENEDYFVDLPTGVLHRMGDIWPTVGERGARAVVAEPREDMKTVKVVYNAGHSHIPYDLRFAVTQIASTLRSMGESGQAVGPITSESLDYMSVSYGAIASSSGVSALSDARSVLNAHKDFVI